MFYLVDGVLVVHDGIIFWAGKRFRRSGESDDGNYDDYMTFHLAVRQVRAIGRMND